MPTERFTKQQFEEALKVALNWNDVRRLGLKDGEETYLCDFGSPHCFLEVRSSVDSSGIARDCGDDSIRAWMVDDDGKPLGGKVQTYVKRTTNWRTNLSKMLLQMARLARWVQPCPKCQNMMRLAVRKADKEVFCFCPTDAENRNTPGYNRHVKFLVLDWMTGDEIKDEERPAPAPRPAAPVCNAPEARTCPQCNTPLRIVNINRGPNAGRKAYSCPKMEGGKYLNHIFEVIQDS